MSSPLAAGFADPVFNGQHVFRALLDALARPGRVIPMPSDVQPPPPLTPELAGVALALADAEAPLWLDAPLAANDGVAAFLRFHTGARIVVTPDRAAFALVADPDRMPPLGSFELGTDEYPDRSTTIVLALPALVGGQPLRLVGPGIEGSVNLAPPLPAGFAESWRTNGALFPRGVDLLFVGPGQVVGLPRSARLLGSA